MRQPLHSKERAKRTNKNSNTKERKNLAKQKLGKAAFAAALLCALPLAAEGAPVEELHGTTQSGIKEQHFSELPAPQEAAQLPAEKPATSHADTTAVVRVQNITIEGQDIYSEEELAPLLQNAIGKEHSFQELEALARSITRHFHEHGYLLARTVLPPQEIQNGTIKLRVTVGRYGDIQIKNNAGLRTERIENLLADLKPGDYIQKDKLERALLLLRDIPGIESSASFAPGKQNGYADLNIEIMDGKQGSGQAYLDNHGSRYTGKNRIGINWNQANLSGNGDLLSAGIILGKDRRDWRLSCRYPLQDGADIGIGIARQSYTLGQHFGALHADGVATTYSADWRYPLLRSRTDNLNLYAGYEHKTFQDNVGSYAINARKKINALRLGIDGSTLQGSSMTAYGLDLVTGKLSSAQPLPKQETCKQKPKDASARAN